MNTQLINHFISEVERKTGLTVVATNKFASALTGMVSVEQANYLAGYMSATIEVLKKARDKGMDVFQAAYLLSKTTMSNPNIQKELITKSKCTKGCNFCCHIEVGIFPGEVDSLASKFKDLIDVQKLKLQNDTADWNKLTPEQASCVFLKEGACSIYESRPTICRNYYVASDPKLCDPFENQNGLVKIMQFTGFSIVESALSTVLQYRGDLPKMHKELYKLMKGTVS